jgi:hypothetical protein
LPAKIDILLARITKITRSIFRMKTTPPLTSEEKKQRLLSIAGSRKADKLSEELFDLIEDYRKKVNQEELKADKPR